MSGSCSSCGEPVVWAMVRKLDGTYKRMPIDPEPVPGGNLAIYRDHLGGLNARTLGKGDALEEYERPGRTHFASCKYADRHRTRSNGLPGNVVAIAEARRRRSKT